MTSSRPEFGIVAPGEAARPRRRASGILIAIIAASVFLGCFSALGNTFTDHRLMPLFLLRDHLSVYLPPNDGPMLSTLYPPLSVLMYAPAAIFHSPQFAFLVAGLLSQLFCFGPLLIALHIASAGAGFSRFHALLIGTAFILFCNLSEILGTVYLVHADPPAICLAAVALVCLTAFIRSDRRELLVLSAILASLAPWAKQTAVPIVIVIPTVLVARRNFRALRTLLLAVACTEAVALAAAQRAFDLRMLFLWMITIPSHHPWKGVWSTVLEDANRILLRENLFALAALGTAVIIHARRRFYAPGQALADLTSKAWAIAAFAGVMFWPTSLLGFVKVGGAYNTLLYSTYFLNVGVALLAMELLEKSSHVLRLRTMYAAIGTVIALLSCPIATTAAKSVLHPGRILHSPSQEAYEFSRRFPGEVYFPWHPLSVYMAEGKLYHFELGICDRVAAGIRIDAGNFRRYLPPNMKYVAYKGTPPSCTLDLLPEFNRPVRDDRLPNWIIYARKR